MAKILFIVNEHPNEAFAISVARETAKRLKAAGREIVWVKTGIKDTLLGRALKNPNAKVSERTSGLIYNRRFAKLSELIQKYGPCSVYDFHCTPPDDILWRAGKSEISPDFHISRYGKDSVNVVEIKAYYRKLPERILQRTEKARQSFPAGAHYLEETTSQALTRQKGLMPKEFGKAIAKTIAQITRAGRKPGILIDAGVVKRVFPKQKRRAGRRIR
jgi:hypothetical protein